MFERRGFLGCMLGSVFTGGVGRITVEGPPLYVGTSAVLEQMRRKLRIMELAQAGDDHRLMRCRFAFAVTGEKGGPRRVISGPRVAHYDFDPDRLSVLFHAEDWVPRHTTYIASIILVDDRGDEVGRDKKYINLNAGGWSYLRSRRLTPDILKLTYQISANNSTD